MTSVVNTKFAVKPVAAALALAVSAGAAYAAPTPNQMPGWGTVVAVSLGSAGTSQGGVGTPLTGLISGGGIGIDGKVVIRWGGTGAPFDATNPVGFNLGANATFLYGAISAGSAVLNIDASGNPSQIYGNLVSTAGPIAPVGPLVGCGACAFAPSIFVSNANGIVVGAGARIVVPPPSGLGLIGADLNNTTSINEFIANNTWAVPGAPALGTSYISYGTVPTTGNVDIAGAINGDLVTNTPTKYILVAGNNVNVMSTGNLFANKIVIDAGVVATATKASVGGLTNQTVNRLWNVDTGVEQACCFVGPLAGNLSVDPTATGNIVNEGSVSALGIAGTDYITLQAKGNIRSGIAGNTSTQIGLYSDLGIYIDSYSNTSTVELYNVVSGYTTNKTLPFLYVNTYAAFSTPAFRSNVIVNAVKPGAQPSSIATTYSVLIYGGDVTISSTINHLNAAGGGTQQDYDLIIDASKTLNVNAAIGGGQDVVLISGGNMSITGNVLSDTNSGGAGGIYIYNNGAGATTTISGNLLVPSTSSNNTIVQTYGPLTISGTNTNVDNSITVRNLGTGAGNSTTISGNTIAGNGVNIYNALSATNFPLTVSGNVTAGGNVYIGNYGASIGNSTTISGNVTSTGGNVSIASYGLITGNLTITGTLSASGDVNIFSDGNAQVRNVVAGDDINATVLGLSLVVDGPWVAADDLNISSTLATTSLQPAGTLTAPTVNLMGLKFVGVNANNGTYTSGGQKPAFQIQTNDLNVSLTGNINAPIAGNTNWPLNSMDIMPLVTLAPVFVSVTANGGGFQAVNLKVLGDMIFDTAATRTPFIGVPLTTGGFPAGGLQGNLGSQLITQSTGYTKIIGTPTLTLFGPPVAAQWPGGASFIAGTTLELLTPFYNAWSVASPPFGGVFFVAPYIALSGYIATSGTAWANFSTKPVTGDPTVYQIRQTGPNAFGFEATQAFVKNNYLLTVVGGAVCGVLGPTTWVACP